MDPDKAKGMLLGLAVGDALGATLEFGPRRPIDNLHTEMTGGGPFGLRPGQWTDDTAMGLALGTSLLENKAFDPLAVLREWSAWYIHGTHSCTGTCFDIGNATARALDSFLGDPTRVPTIPDDALGNGSLMRLAPAVLFSRTQEAARDLGYRQSRLTHGEKAAQATAGFAELLFRLLCSEADRSAVPPGPATLPREKIVSSGFYRATLDAAYWAVGTTTSFEDALVQAVNLGDDSDTVGAVAGQLAGAIYGASAIPWRWAEAIAWKSKLVAMAEALTELRS